MKNKLILSLLSAMSINLTFADCSFTFVNKSDHSVTLQGFFLEKGDQQSNQGWITVEPTRQITQVRTGDRCNASFKHSGQVATRVNLKNSSGYWIGNKGFLFAADRSYSHYSGNYAIADDGSNVTLSNGEKISRKEFKVSICDSNVENDDCK